MNLLEMLQRNAAEWGDRSALIFLDENGAETLRRSWRESAELVASQAARLREEIPAGAALLLVFDPGPDFCVALLAAIAAKLVAVPLPPMEAARAPAQCRFIEQLLKDTAAPAILAGGHSHQLLQQHLPAAAGVLRLLDFAALPVAGPPFARTSRPTSGSTSAPKGVSIRQRHLRYNAASCCAQWRIDCDSILVSWMPNQHSFGLIYNCLLPLHAGCTLVAMAPTSFLARPGLWLEAVDRYRGSHGAAATFGYQTLVDKLPLDAVAKLEVSCWQVGLFSAEAVRRGVCEAFSTKFAGLGLPPDFFCALYGLSESGPIASMPIATPMRYRTKPGAPAELDLACVGPALPGTTLIAVDPHSGRPVAAGEQGEIWVAGPSVTEGYFRREQENEQSFARLPGFESTFFRTGDLGHFDGGYLTISGRLKEMFIIRGKNYYPQDLEWAALQTLPTNERWAAAAFMDANDGDSELTLVLEARAGLAESAYRTIAHKALAAVAADLGLVPDRMVLVAPGAIPRTASGKIRRLPCRAAWAADRLEVLHQEARPRAESVAEAAGSPSSALAGLVPLFAALVGITTAEVDEAAPL